MDFDRNEACQRNLHQHLGERLANGDLATPVSITANTTYIASYHTSGAYVATDNFFTSALASGPLTAPSNASSGGNGVYAYGGTNTAGIFPTNTFSSANYYADVVFRVRRAAATRRRLRSTTAASPRPRIPRSISQPRRCSPMTAIRTAIR